MSRRTWSSLAACLVLVAGCSPTPSVAPPAGPTARSASSAFCEEIGGSWDQARSACKRTDTNERRDEIQLSARYPDDLLSDAAAGPPLKEFVKGFFTTFGLPGNHVDAHSGQADVDFTIFEHAPGIKSVVFAGSWYFAGLAHPNDEITTFTFDLAAGKQLSLADLFCEGVDPLTALPPLVRPHLEPLLVEGVEISRFDPGTLGGYADDYRAWYLDGPDLVLVMPSERAGPTHAGQWEPRIPLAELHSVLRGRECKA